MNTSSPLSFVAGAASVGVTVDLAAIPEACTTTVDMTPQPTQVAEAMFTPPTSQSPSYEPIALAEELLGNRTTSKGH